MEQFTNETIDTANLPKFEEVPFTPLHPSYWKVLLVNTAIFFCILGIGLAAFLYFVNEMAAYSLYLITAYTVFLALFVFFLHLSYKKRGFAFREHDVLFKHGVIANTIIVIPYNRIQHVALHEGLISRAFGLAEVKVYTAGGKESDIEIPGIEKAQAESIKQLLMGKIQKQL